MAAATEMPAIAQKTVPSPACSEAETETEAGAHRLRHGEAQAWPQQQGERPGRRRRDDQPRPDEDAKADTRERPSADRAGDRPADDHRRDRAPRLGGRAPENALY